MDDQGWGGALGYIATALGGGGATALFNWMSQRSKDRTIAKSEVAKAAETLVKTALAAAHDQIKRLEDEVETLRSEAADLRQQIGELRADHNDCEQRTAKLQVEIERLMAGPIPDYTTLKRPRPRRA